METQPTKPSSKRLETLFTKGRLGGYLSRSCPRLRIDSFRVLACANNLDGFLYLDVYKASANDTQLVGREFLISPSMQILKSVSYIGGFRIPEKTTITAREIFNNVLKPCRYRYLSLGKRLQECKVRGQRFRYTYQVTQNNEHEVIALKNDDGWETVHEIRFSARQEG